MLSVCIAESITTYRSPCSDFMALHIVLFLMYRGRFVPYLSLQGVIFGAEIRHG